MEDEEIRKMARNNCNLEIDDEELANVLISIKNKLGGCDRELIECICSLYNLGYKSGYDDCEEEDRYYESLN